MCLHRCSWQSHESPTTSTLQGRTHPRTSKRRSEGDNRSGRKENFVTHAAYPKLSSRSSLSIALGIAFAITVCWDLLAWDLERGGEKRGRTGTVCGSVCGSSSWGVHRQSWMNVICATGACPPGAAPSLYPRQSPGRIPVRFGASSCKRSGTIPGPAPPGVARPLAGYLT